MSQKFQRVIEDFTCLNCGQEVQGGGYTNHCPNCLWSRHVDIYPGDRSEDCGGMMEPVGVEIKKGQTRVVHKCQKCGRERVVDAAEGDDNEKLVLLSAA